MQTPLLCVLNPYKQQNIQQFAETTELIAAPSEEISVQADSMMDVVKTLDVIVRGPAKSRSVLH